jgi:hypothetical protein
MKIYMIRIYMWMSLEYIFLRLHTFNLLKVTYKLVEG